jgi:hypothetical protein
MGGTMRLGSYACRLAPDSLAFRSTARKSSTSASPSLRVQLPVREDARRSGLRIVGRSLDGKFVEIVELPGHPWYVAVQFHPEFKSKPLRPHPLFAASSRPPQNASSLPGNGDQRDGIGDEAMTSATGTSNSELRTWSAACSSEARSSSSKSRSKLLISVRASVPEIRIADEVVLGRRRWC